MSKNNSSNYLLVFGHWPQAKIRINWPAVSVTRWQHGSQVCFATFI